MKEEYTRETYPSFGKKYNGEKAIISLTSWRARINTVSKTLFSLLKQCPGFHIVLVLSEEEFPKMMDELPENLKVFAENELIEILWVYKNYKSFKKVLFTMDKYRDVPVISADDDCIYTCNYAQMLYDKWIKNKNSFITCYGTKVRNTPHTGGAACLFPPYIFKTFGINILQESYIYTFTNQDDNFYTVLRDKLNLKRYITLNNFKHIYRFHDEIMPCHNEIKNTKAERDKLWNKIYMIVSKAFLNCNSAKS